MTAIHLFGATNATTQPACCTCNPQVCATDDTGDHCIERSCGVCLHGCPATDDQPCCQDGGDQ